MKFDDTTRQRAFDEGGIDPNTYDASALYWADVARWYETKLSSCQAEIATLHETCARREEQIASTLGKLDEANEKLDDFEGLHVCDCCYCLTGDPVDAGGHIQCQSCTKLANAESRLSSWERAYACPSPCNLCEGLDHHWYPDVDEDHGAVLVCKHCPARRPLGDDENPDEPDSIEVPQLRVVEDQLPDVVPWRNTVTGEEGETCRACGHDRVTKPAAERQWTVPYSGGTHIVRLGDEVELHDGSRWKVGEPTGRKIYSPSGFGGTMTFKCYPLNDTAGAYKREEGGHVDLCGDSIAQSLARFVEIPFPELSEGDPVRAQISYMGKPVTVLGEATLVRGVWMVYHDMNAGGKVCSRIESIVSEVTGRE